MALQVGSCLGPYQILAPLGAGGMGEVYRARDPKLNRDVALKILPDTFSSDADRVTRFRREAQVLASLNHPNIGHIYGLEDTTTPYALVLELIEGPTLADRIAEGPLALDEAIPIARQIAEALEAAHEHGVVHRDLKPANVKVCDDGRVKVLDFGLAKAIDPAAASSSEALNSPTLTVRATQMGLVLGTAAYMAPEQAKGKAVDRRADIWAFGAVLYEMLSGRRAFQGDDISDTLAAVLRQDVDWGRLPATTPPAVRRLLARCLDRDVRHRLRDIGEARVALEDPSAGLEAPTVPLALPAATRPVWRRALPIAVAALVAAALGAAAAWTFKPAPAAGLTRFRIMLDSIGSGRTFTSPTRKMVAISPDGSQIAFVANGRLYLRRITELDAQPIAGSEAFSGTSAPAFSPDGRSIAFWAASDLTIKRLPTTGGAAVTICQAENPFGIDWSEDGIVFGQGDRGTIMRVSPNGGTPEVIASTKPGELTDGPQLLPGGTHVLFVTTSQTGLDRWDKARIVVESLATHERKTIIDGGSGARYLPTGHLLYASGGILLAVPFDATRMEVTGSRIPIIEGIRRAVPAATGAAQYSVSNTGTLVYIPGPVSAAVSTLGLALVDRHGTINRLNLPPSAYDTPRASPDGTRIAFGVDTEREAFIGIYDLSGKSSMRPLTFGSNNRYPVWTPDSKRVVYQSDRDGDYALFWQAADGTGTAERLTRPQPGETHIPNAFSPTTNTLFFTVSKGTEFSLWTLSLADRKAAPFGDVGSRSVPLNAAISPDGRWVAYQTDRGRRTTVYVQPIPPTGAVYQLLARAADQPHEAVWSPDGKELIYNPRAGGFESVSVTTSPEFAFGNPTALPRPFQLTPPQGHRSYDITREGLFLALVTSDTGSQSEPNIAVVTNWFDELRERMSTP